MANLPNDSKTRSMLVKKVEREIEWEAYIRPFYVDGVWWVHVKTYRYDDMYKVVEKNGNIEFELVRSTIL